MLGATHGPDGSDLLHGSVPDGDPGESRRVGRPVDEVGSLPVDGVGSLLASARHPKVHLLETVPERDVLPGRQDTGNVLPH
eukprot:1054965-Alexandrium_andersonii.AAC.1